jgi:ubiquinone biosynthesis protein
MQKTLLNIEGVGRLLHPEIDIWATARPVLERIWQKQRGPKMFLKRLRQRVPEWLAAAPDMPQLMHSYLEQVTSGSLQLRIASEDLRKLEANSRRSAGIAVPLVVGATLAICAVLLQVLDSQLPRWSGVSIGAAGLALGAAIGFIAAFRSR